MPMDKEAYLKHTLNSRMYKAIYSPKELAEYEGKLYCPQNDRVCEEGRWMPERTLSGSRLVAEHITEAFPKLRANIGELVICPGSAPSDYTCRGRKGQA